MNIKVSVFRLLAILALRFDTFFYKLLSLICLNAESGHHPKHLFNRYSEWFASRLKSTDIVLDIGSKYGHMCATMSSTSSYVYGIELDPVSHREATSCYKDISNLYFINGDATSYDFSSLPRQITVVTLSNVLEHIDCRARFLRDLLTSLKSNNQSNKLILLIRVPLIERDWVACYKRYLGLDYRLDSTHFIEYTLEELLQELHQASLSVCTLDVRFGEAFVECECI